MGWYCRSNPWSIASNSGSFGYQHQATASLIRMATELPICSRHFLLWRSDPSGRPSLILHQAARCRKVSGADFFPAQEPPCGLDASYLPQSPVSEYAPQGGIDAPPKPKGRLIFGSEWSPRRTPENCGRFGEYGKAGLCENQSEGKRWICVNFADGLPRTSADCRVYMRLIVRLGIG